MLKIAKRVLEVAAARISEPSGDVPGSLVRLDLDNAVVVERALIGALIGVNRSAVAQGLDVARIELDRGAIVGNGAVSVLLCFIGDGAAVIGGGVTGVEREAVAEIADRFVEVRLPGIGAGTAEIVEGARPSLAGLGLDQRGAGSDLLLERGISLPLAPGEALVGSSPSRDRHYRRQHQRTAEKTHS